MSFWKEYDWTKVDKKRMGKWGIGYVVVLILLLAQEMAGIGNPLPGDTLTEFSTWLASLSRPVAAALLLFVTWLPIHFWRRVGPILFARKEQ